MIFNPMANYIIAEGDRLIAMGEDENVKQFSEACLA
jgi:K+/H+ antiporter YhaU regulatory subunit KhtT